MGIKRSEFVEKSYFLTLKFKDTFKDDQISNTKSNVALNKLEAIKPPKKNKLQSLETQNEVAEEINKMLNQNRFKPESKVKFLK